MFEFQWSAHNEFCLMTSDGDLVGAAQIGRSPGENDPDGAVGETVLLDVIEMLFVVPGYRGREKAAADRLIDEVFAKFPVVFHTGVLSKPGHDLCESRGILRHPVRKSVRDENGKRVLEPETLLLSRNDAEAKGRELLARAIERVR